jgi:hypothetical protein
MSTHTYTRTQHIHRHGTAGNKCSRYSTYLWGYSGVAFGLYILPTTIIQPQYTLPLVFIPFLPFFSFFTIVIVYIMVTITTLTPFVCIVANSGFPFYLSSTVTNLVRRGPHIAYDYFRFCVLLPPAPVHHIRGNSCQCATQPTNQHN